MNEINISSFDKFKIYRGRQFLNDPEANYILPSDKESIEGEALGHLTRKWLFDGNYSSPIEEKLLSGAAVLEIGCGAGYWTTEMALENSSSTFVGIDINPHVFPPENQRSSNIGFIECNVIHGVPFPSNTFDFVYICRMWGAFTEPQWSKLIEEIVRVLKIDGWLEIVEGNPEFKNTGKTFKYISEVAAVNMFKERGIQADIFNVIPKFIEQNNNLTDFNYTKVDAPLGDWKGFFGVCMLKSVRKFFEEISYLFEDKLKITKEQYNKMLDDFEKEANENKTEMELYRFFAKKSQN